LVIVGSSTATIVAFFWVISVNPAFVIHYDPRDTRKSWVLVTQDKYVRAAAFEYLSRVGEQTSRQCGACSNVLLRSADKLQNWSQRCLRAHGLFADGLRGWVLEFFQNFCRFAGAWLLRTFVIFNWHSTGLET
jgi:hypothetical protein